jgi:hypothetical protein
MPFEEHQKSCTCLLIAAARWQAEVMDLTEWSNFRCNGAFSCVKATKPVLDVF